jgi:hypothetical protein
VEVFIVSIHDNRETEEKAVREAHIGDYRGVGILVHETFERGETAGKKKK